MTAGGCVTHNREWLAEVVRDPAHRLPGRGSLRHRHGRILHAQRVDSTPPAICGRVLVGGASQVGCARSAVRSFGGPCVFGRGGPRRLLPQ